MIRITRRVEFSAAHFYHNPNLSAEENLRLYGKCNNPHGHGHNYAVEVTIAGHVDPNTGLLVRCQDLDTLVKDTVIRQLDYRYLNQDVPEFEALVPTSENLARVIENRLNE